MFKRNELIRHLEEEFPDVFHNQFAYEWLHKCIDKAEDTPTKNAALHRLMELLPDQIEEEELAEFFEFED